MDIKISVIILIYNAEEYIERCVRTLFEQTLQEIEYIFVDDCSSDRSIEILYELISQYPQRQSQVHIVRNESNRKQAYCRSIAMQMAKGEYIINCDSDDWVDTDLYENMYKKATLAKSDIVTCDITVHMGKDTSKICSHYDGNALQCLKDMCFNSYGCTKLIKRDLIEKYSIYPFPNINCGEDLNVIVRALAHANRITFISQAGYHYWRNNNNSITSRDPLLNFEEYLFENIKKISEYLNSNDIQDAEKITSFVKLNQRGILLWGTSQGTYKSVKAWTNIWPETNKYIRDYPGSSSKQTRFISMFCKSPILLWCFVKCYRRYVKFNA